MSRFEIKDIECIRRDNILFQNLGFSLEEGALLHIDGVNGSGKSSLMQLCAGLIQATQGEILWNDTNIADCRYTFQSQLSYLAHNNAVKTGLTARENMAVMHALCATQAKIDYTGILKKIGLPDMDDVLLSRMSAGQKRRVGLARFFMSAAKLWLLDEPFNALDKHGKIIIEKLIVNHCSQGGMAIFATHQKIKIDDYPLQYIHLGKNDD